VVQPSYGSIFNDGTAMATIAEEVKEKCLMGLGDGSAIVECVELSSSCDGGAKLELTVVSDKFQGVPLLKRQRMVNEYISDVMTRIHAVTMKTWTVQQYESKK